MSSLPAHADRTNAAASSPIERLVLLGASNVMRSLPLIVTMAEQGFGRPLQVLTAIGHGRSYGAASRCLGRELPGIRGCGIWRDIASQPHVRTAALVTDIGNDLLYGFAPLEIARWVEECLDRLAAMGATTVITALPVCNLEKISRWRYHAMRSVLYPQCKIPLPTLCEGAHALNGLVHKAAERRKLPVIEPRASWYGFDPVHVRRRALRSAWGSVFGSWGYENVQFSRAKTSFLQAAYLRSRRAESARLFGFQLRTRQPAARLRGGTTVALY